MVKTGLFIFHRDFRLVDNNGLLESQKQCDKVYTCFIFTNEQVKTNKYKSKNSIEFMIESLENLQEELKKQGGDLLIFYGNRKSILKKLIQELNIETIFMNQDYTPYAKEREKEINKICSENKILCNMSHDYCICPPGEILNNNEQPYVRFNSFYESYFFNYDIETPNKQKITKLSKTNKTFDDTITLKYAFTNFVKEKNENLAVHGGRDLALKQLKHSVNDLSKYSNTRDELSKDTSMLSAYIKYGCVSIREVVYSFRIKYTKHHEFIRQLIWRDFYMHLLYHHPTSLGKLHNKKMASIKWSKNKNLLDAWKNGKTGFPLVDAGMRQLNETGYMHNRARMLVASMLSKIFFLDWREGEKYFARNLVDYDVSSNSGNWQAVVGGGLYSMPWFRVMSPWAQSENHDSQANYIKEWIPELENVSSKHIHKWYKYYKKYTDVDYPKPIIDYNKKREEYMEKMKSYLN